LTPKHGRPGGRRRLTVPRSVWGAPGAGRSSGFRLMPTGRPFPTPGVSGFAAFVPVTAAGPRRIRTVFPHRPCL